MLLQIACSIFFSALLIAGPKRIYWKTKAWRYQNPEAESLTPGVGAEASVRLYECRTRLPVTGVAEGQWYYSLIEEYNYFEGAGYDF